MYACQVSNLPVRLGKTRLSSGYSLGKGRHAREAKQHPHINSEPTGAVMAKNLLTLQPKLSREEMHWLWFLLDSFPRDSYYKDKQIPALFWFKEARVVLKELEAARSYAKGLTVRPASERDFESLFWKLKEHCNS